MHLSRKMLTILGIVAAICLVVLVVVLTNGLQQDVGAGARRILHNTIEEGSRIAQVLHDE